ncbi:MAG: formamidopyrimidine-DNA glycosylase [Actinomycetota bacterium]|nr:formamidopyrimidine-DNA glycosylase [Actinomycetota bacterium]
MPELIEVEYYRRAAEKALGRTILSVDAPDAWFLKRGTTADTLEGTLPGRQATAVRRRGKLLLLDLGPVSADPHVEVASTTGVTLGLRFGMTGRLIVDDSAAIERLEYASARDERAWDRFGLRFADGGVLRVQDPRRLGGVELEPDESRLGPDALTVTPRALRALLDRGSGPLKARLLDQSRLAGVGNLLADETLWRAGIDPARPAGSLETAELQRLHRHLRSTIRRLLDRGGSHLGDLQIARLRGGRCPRDGTALERRVVGGRTTYSCPAHQH